MFADDLGIWVAVNIMSESTVLQQANDTVNAETVNNNMELNPTNTYHSIVRCTAESTDRVNTVAGKQIRTVTTMQDSGVIVCSDMKPITLPNSDVSQPWASYGPSDAFFRPGRMVLSQFC